LVSGIQRNTVLIELDLAEVLTWVLGRLPSPREQMICVNHSLAGIGRQTPGSA